MPKPFQVNAQSRSGEGTKESLERSQLFDCLSMMVQTGERRMPIFMPKICQVAIPDVVKKSPFENMSSFRNTSRIHRSMLGNLWLGKMW
ncbi:hypothetical protein LIER_34648 [Lithospermum erythrorhizon]|uniref:Uncharacterized protein n=1 Tax=Lithospermum erythrorhizon TaxID=34254 RepID=A0AAV3S2G7_LITER